jgi:hypothetical protein
MIDTQTTFTVPTVAYDSSFGTMSMLAPGTTMYFDGQGLLRQQSAMTGMLLDTIREGKNKAIKSPDFYFDSEAEYRRQNK